METEDVILSMMGDGATNQGTFGETMNLAALWKLPVVFVIINNQFGMGTALHRHSRGDRPLAQVRGLRRARHALRRHGRARRARRGRPSALRCAREERKPQLVEAVTYRFRGHSMADPEEYRTKDEVEEWRERDPIQAFAKRLVDEGVITQDQFEELDEKAIETVDEAVKFADESPFPDLDSLYDDVYVFDGDVPGWWTVDERSPEVHRGEHEREAGELPHQLAEAGAAYANVGDQRGAQPPAADRRGRATSGEGEVSGDEPEAEGGAD